MTDALTGDRLLDRGTELAALGALFEDVADGRGRLTVIEGAAGIGKTTLLSASRAEAERRGWRILSARGSELEREFAFGVARQLFEPTLRGSSEPERKMLLAGAAALSAPAVWLGGDLRDADPGDAYARLHGLYWLTANLAGGPPAAPLLLTIDDAHQGDAPSLRFLAYLANRLDELPVVIVIATRPTHDDRLLAPLVSLLGDKRTELVRPQPLSEAAVATLVARRLGAFPEPAFTRACRAATGGNPFFLGELLRELGTRGVTPDDASAEGVGEVGPRSVAREILVRLAALPPATAGLVRAVAILGDGASILDAAQLAEVDLPTARVAADALAGAGILVADAALGFVHPIIATAVASECKAHERALLHARAAELLVARAAAPEAVAAHLLQIAPSGDRERWKILRGAASDADARGAPDAAIAYLTRALAETPHGELRRLTLVELGAAEARAGLPPAVAHLEEALKLAATPAVRATVALELGRALMLSGRLSEAVATFERALELDLGAGSRDLVLNLEMELVGAARFDPVARPLGARRLVRIGRDVSGDSAAERLVLANLAFEMVYLAEPIPRIVDVAQRALADGQLIRERGTALPITGLPVWALIFCERYGMAARAADEMLAAARAQGSASGHCLAAAIQATIAYRQGRLADAEEWGRAALRPDTPRIEGPMAVGALIDALIDLGQPEAANEALRAAGLAGEVPDLPIFAVMLGARARLRLAEHDPEGALADALAVGDRAIAWGNRNRTFVQWRATAALARHELGDAAGARHLAAEGVAGAREWGADRATGIELRAQALVTGGERSIEMLRDAVQLLERAGAKLEVARVNADLGAALRRHRMTRDARAPLLAAFRGATETGAAALVERTRTELAAAGVREPHVSGTVIDDLTASERRVARLALNGLSNPKIAQSLFISTKTVEKHLSSAYRKLGVRSRAQLAERIAQPTQWPALERP